MAMSSVRPVQEPRLRARGGCSKKEEEDARWAGSPQSGVDGQCGSVGKGVGSGVRHTWV